MDARIGKLEVIVTAEKEDASESKEPVASTLESVLEKKKGERKERQERKRQQTERKYRDGRK